MAEIKKMPMFAAVCIVLTTRHFLKRTTLRDADHSETRVNTSDLEYGVL